MFRSAPELNRTKQSLDVLPCELNSLPGFKAMSLFQAFSAFISTVSIDQEVRVYVQPCAMSLDPSANHPVTYESTVVWPAV